MENKKASVEIGVNLSSSLMNASLTMLTIIMGLLVFIIEKREVNIVFYILFSISVAFFVISVYCSGKGIDKARKAIYHDNFSQYKTKKYYNNQAIFCFLGILMAFISILFSKEDKTEEIEMKRLNSNIENIITQNKENEKQFKLLKNENDFLQDKISNLELKINKVVSSQSTETLNKKK